LNRRHIEHDDLVRLIDELSAARKLHERPPADARAERLMEQLIKSLHREKRS
jgi:hypothetical protein